MKVRGNQRPERYSLEVMGGNAVLRFSENIVEIKEEDAGERPGFVGLEYDRYTITVPFDAGLRARIDADVDIWISKAKTSEKIELATSIRKRRNELLADTDCTRIDDYPISAVQREAYKEYRQALRELPEQAGFPYSVEFPTLDIN